MVQICDNTDTLILDNVGSRQRSPVVLGKHVNGSCLAVWNNLKHLSGRGINFFGLLNIDCFTNLVTVAAGFNSTIAVDSSMASSLAKFNNLKYLDLS